MVKTRWILAPFFLFFLVFALYSTTLTYGFISDDISGLVDVAATWKSPLVAITKTVIHGHMVVWYYLYQMFGLTPAVYRGLNILCHALSVVLVFFDRFDSSE